MPARDALVYAIDRAFQVCGDMDVVQSSATMLAHNSTTIRALVGPSEIPDLAFSVIVRGSRHVEMGFGAVMQDRVILAWQTGFRPRPESRTVAYADVVRLQCREKGADRSLGRGAVLTLSCTNGQVEHLGFGPGGHALATEVIGRIKHHRQRLLGARAG